ncbi:hypothetical protein GMOD_00008784 [Pyrenophora seminiperda CCB06]|uniref:Uncharacterized protein n=1 Tax=Pyrenophora seminiperda CCB06 TaxID=1302712 RepID=A0A3M7M5W5_9PLEO|nr:hypothetical protein GMOD_00008784 [Pyrenophora seminiperda CCB06]
MVDGDLERRGGWPVVRRRRRRIAFLLGQSESSARQRTGAATIVGRRGLKRTMMCTKETRICQRQRQRQRQRRAATLTCTVVVVLSSLSAQCGRPDYADATCGISAVISAPLLGHIGRLTAETRPREQVASRRPRFLQSGLLLHVARLGTAPGTISPQARGKSYS